jgi:Serine/threonine protein phosphatase
MLRAASFGFVKYKSSKLNSEFSQFPGEDMKIVAKTDQGKVRKDNQDSFAAGELPGGVVWAVVCDGMGGAAGGSVASQTAVKMISEKIASGYQHGMSDRSIKNLLTSVVENANSSIYEMSCSVEKPQRHGHDGRCRHDKRQRTLSRSCRRQQGLPHFAGGYNPAHERSFGCSGYG